MINPSLTELRDRIAPGSAQFIIEYADRRPRLKISDISVDAFAGVHRVRARVMNSGAFPTNITQRALALRSVQPVSAELILGDGMELVSRHRHFALGHIAAHSRSSECEWFVRAGDGGAVTIRSECQRGVDTEAVVALA